MLDPGRTTSSATCALQKCPNSARTTTTTCGIAWRTSWPCQCPIGVATEVVLAPAAYWASWAECLSMPEHRRSAHSFCRKLERPPSRAKCGREAQNAAAVLTAAGTGVPAWSKFSDPDFRAPQPLDPKVGGWTHGWQFPAPVARDTLFATSVHLSPWSTHQQALRTSQREPCASRHLT